MHAVRALAGAAQACPGWSIAGRPIRTASIVAFHLIVRPPSICESLWRKASRPASRQRPGANLGPDPLLGVGDGANRRETPEGFAEVLVLERFELQPNVLAGLLQRRLGLRRGAVAVIDSRGCPETEVRPDGVFARDVGPAHDVVRGLQRGVVARLELRKRQISELFECRGPAKPLANRDG